MTKSWRLEKFVRYKRVAICSIISFGTLELCRYNRVSLYSLTREKVCTRVSIEKNTMQK